MDGVVEEIEINLDDVSTCRVEELKPPDVSFRMVYCPQCHISALHLFMM